MPTAAFTIAFDLSAKTLSLQDTTDYAGQSLTIADYRGTIRASLLTAAGSTVFYDNLGDTGAPDVVPNTSRYNTTTINLPADADGNILGGKYTVTYGLSNIALDTYFQQVNDYVYQNPAVTVCLQTTVDCDASQITSKDVTDYGPYVLSITRVHKLYAPPASGLGTFTGTLASLTVNGIYTTTWTAELVSTVTYANPDGSTTVSTFSGVKEFQVECDSDLCTILCCLDNIKKTYDRLVCVNPTQAANFRATIYDPVNENAIYFMMAQGCGNTTKAATYRTAIESISGCGKDCGCGTTDTPIPVIPSSNVGSITVVDSPDVSIAVTSNTSGNTTTYHVQVSATLQNIINNSYNSIVVTDTPDELTITPTGTNPITYTVSFTGTIPDEENHVEVLIGLSRSTSSSPPYATIFSKQFVIETGTGNFNPHASWSWVFAGNNSGNTGTSLATIQINDFLNDNLNLFTAQCNIMKLQTPFAVWTPTIATSFEVVVNYFEEDATKLYLSFIDKQSGAVLTLTQLFSFLPVVPSNLATIFIKLTLFA